ncbi:MAG: pilus assembly protein CpaB [Moorella sp. (in: firmicutes)]|nr:pilus assembly protein CpaB [Moorella sp. (in: firmicutes)]
MKIFGRNKNYGSGRSIPVPVILAIIFGLGVAVTSGLYYQRYISTHQAMTQVIVPAHNINAYNLIKAGDLTWRQVPVGAVEPGTARKPEDLIGKVALVELYQGEQVRLERVGEAANEDRQVIAVNIDLARSGGGYFSPGDLVDVYFAETENVPGAILASNARLLQLVDAQGNPIVPNQQAGLLQQSAQAPKTPAVAVLAVSPADIPQVARGAANGSRGIVLVKKMKP